MIDPHPLADPVSEQPEPWRTRTRERQIRAAVAIEIEDRKRAPVAGIVDSRDPGQVLELRTGEATEVDVVALSTAPGDPLSDAFIQTIGHICE
ncbi:MAG: hypothetical protein V3V67_09930 [Myxococcota bacterium]